MNKTKLRKLTIELLDDSNGISDSAYIALQDFTFDFGGEGCSDDIFDKVENVGGRFFLNEDHGIVA